MENENMNYEVEVMEPEVDTFEMEAENSGIGTGVAMLIGAGLTAATVAVVKLGKKAIAAHRDKKKVRQPAEGETVEVTDEDIMDVTE